MPKPVMWAPSPEGRGGIHGTALSARAHRAFGPWRSSATTRCRRKPTEAEDQLLADISGHLF